MKHPAPHTPQLSERGGGAEAGCSNSADAGRARNCGMACESCSQFQKDKMLSVFLAFVFRAQCLGLRKGACRSESQI